MAISASTSTSTSLVLLLGSMIGCGLEPLPAPKSPFGNVCDGRSLSLCDVRDDACQRALFEYTACLGERPATDRPRVEVLTPFDLVGGRRVPTSTLTLPFVAIDTLRPALRLLDPATSGPSMLPAPKATPATVTLPGAEVGLVVANGGWASREAVLGLVEGFASVLIDREHDLRSFYARYGTDYDRALALLAVQRGEARLYVDLIDAALARTSYPSYLPEDADLPPIAELVSALRGASETFSPLYGRAMVAKAWLSGATTAVRALYDAPPSSTAEVLARSSAWAGTSTTPGPHRAPDLPMQRSGVGDYQLVGTAVLGAWGSLAFQQAAAMALHVDAPPWSLVPKVSDWADDTFFAFHRSSPSPSEAFVWISDWGEPPQDDYIQVSLGEGFTDISGVSIEAASRGRWRVLSQGRRVVIVGADDPSTLEAWTQVGRDALAQPEDGGEMAEAGRGPR